MHIMTTSCMHNDYKHIIYFISITVTHVHAQIAQCMYYNSNF